MGDSNESTRRILLGAIACALAGGIQWFEVATGDGGTLSLLAALGFSFVVVVGIGQLYVRSKRPE